MKITYKTLKSLCIVVLLLLFIIAWSWLLVFYSPEEIVSFIWVENWYLLVFFSSILGWVSSFVSTPFYAAIVTFIIWWLDIFLVSFLAWIGATIWDSIFYYLWYKVKSWVLKKDNKHLKKLHKFIYKRPKWKVFLFIYIYAWFTPFPKDVLVIALSLAWYPFKKVLIPLILGNMTIFLVLWLLALKWVEIF